MEKREPKTVTCFSHFGHLLIKKCHLAKNVMKQKGLSTFAHRHTSTQETAHPCTTTSFVSKPTGLRVFLETRMVRSAEELCAIEKMAAQSMSIKKITEAVFSSCTDKADRIVQLKDTAKNTSFTRI